LWADDLRCEVHYVGTAAHTPGDSIVWIPEHRVLFAGDLLFNGGTPFLLQGSLTGSLHVLKHVLAPLQPDIVVPGHGPVAGPTLIDEVLGYLTFVQSTARAAQAAGLTPLHAALETDLGPYAHLTDPERIVGNLHRAYAEINGVTPGTPIDNDAALTDMVTYNGGKPLTCHA
jgi:cyclase